MSWQLYDLTVWVCSVITEGDVDRVWSCVENAIKLMAEEEDED